MPRQLIQEACTSRGTPPPSRFVPSNFSHLPRPQQHLITRWSGQAVGVLGQPRREPASRAFEAFILAWISLNGWGTCCFDEERDGELIRLMRKERRLQDVFDELRRPGGDLADEVHAFGDLWPIFEARKVRDTHDRAMSIHQKQGRAGLVDYYIGTYPEAERDPNCHADHPQGIEPDWFHTIKALYRVRNNLFHGNKSAWSRSDAEVLIAAAAVLVPTVNHLVNYPYP